LNRIQAHDYDTSPEYNTITYWIIGGNDNNTFYIDGISADLFLLKTLDYETNEQYVLTVSW